MSSIIATTAIRGRFLDIKNTVAQAREIHDQVRYVEDGLLISQNGEIQWFGSWEEGQQHLPERTNCFHVNSPHRTTGHKKTLTSCQMKNIYNNMIKVLPTS
jgi:hypothetical protein